MTIFKKIWYRFKRIILKWASTMSPNTIIQKRFENFDASSDIVNKLQNKYAIIKYHEKFPNNGEMNHFNRNPNHKVEMNGQIYSLSNLTADQSIFSRNTVRIHSLDLNHLHKICKQNLLNHITITNSINFSGNTFGILGNIDDPLPTFELHYQYAIETIDIDVQKIIKQYWKRFISEILREMVNPNTELCSSFLNPKSIQTLNIELSQLLQRL